MKLFNFDFEYTFPSSETYYYGSNYVLAENEESANVVFRDWVSIEDPDTILTSIGITELPMIEQVLPNN